MSLEEEIQRSAKEISTDGYEMSIGELMSLYSNKELIINPEYQRLFRWSISQKTKFIESILLGIPIPPIFVFQTKDGDWELVDGLQRLSTVFEFVGILKKNNGALYPQSILEGTKLLPSLSGKIWGSGEEDSENTLARAQQLFIRRARMRVEILKRESDPQSKYELFQRLNTGGSSLSEQEVRNVIMIMINREFFDWVMQLSQFDPFRVVTAQTENAERQQRIVELVVRFLVYRNIPYQTKLDVNEYLDDGVVQLASDKNLDRNGEEIIFKDTFILIESLLHDDAFTKYDGQRFLGQFVLSAFEVVAVGVSRNLAALHSLPQDVRDKFITDKIKQLWSEPQFRKYSVAGVRGTTRLTNLLNLGEPYFKP